jgi:hypothetical protein
MVALSEMFLRWALEEEPLSPEQRTKLIQMSADYEAISQFSGPSWQAADPGAEMDPISFVASEEARSRGLYALSAVGKVSR